MSAEPTLWDNMPPRARADGPATSAAAAASLPRMTDSHVLLLHAYWGAGPAGLTDEQAADRAGVPVRSCWWKRCGELRALGVIVETGETRAGGAGRQRIVCRAAGAPH